MAIFGYNNAFDLDSATLSATNENSNLPVTNLTDSDVGTVIFRTTANSTQIDLQFSSSVTRRLVVLPNVNLTGSYSATLDAGTGGAGSTDVLSGFTDFKLSTNYKLMVGDIGSDTTATDWRLTISDTSLSTLDIGRAALMKTLDLSINIGFPYGITPISLTTTKRMRGQQIRRYRRTTYYGAETYKRLSFPWGPGITEADAYDRILGQFAYEVGQGSDVFFVQDLSASNWDVQAVWGIVAGLPTMQTDQINLYQGDFEIEEQL
jgi:hypothetical protein